MEYKHYKMFKSVKKWVVASVAAFAMLGLGQVTTQQGTHFGQREVAAADGTTLADAQSAAKTALESAAGTAKDPGNVSWTADKNNGVRMAFGGLGQDLTSEDMHLNTSANVTVSTDDQSAIQQVLSDYENKVASATSVDEVTSLQQEGTAKLALMGVKIQAKAMLAQDYQNVSSGTVYLLNKEAEADAKQTPIRFETSVASQDNYQNTIQNAYQDALTYIDNYSGTAQGLSDEMTSTNISTGLANKIRTLYYPIIQAEYRNDNRYYAYSNMVSTYTLMGNSTVPSDQYSTVLDALEKVNGEVDATPVSAGIHNTNYWMSMGKAMATAGIQALTKQTEAVSSEDKTAIESIANKGLADVAPLMIQVLVGFVLLKFLRRSSQMC
ncbi:KxYKxGKxW signal peptide domain-containing protein [Fructobacillus papyrifericola]|uniref:Uncharacterized protein n=1 Tax=Fructobacillus papyrifericola TaxID=2713172 RepID=A0ABS5QTW7_9LACO|nr:KxYKxGKxW signal peptide domain-containing protein [Fructobacillus papyrifericola]MBS9335851.1 hypothetical protein [Fructobacillus papyrifericola]